MHVLSWCTEQLDAVGSGGLMGNPKRLCLGCSMEIVQLGWGEGGGEQNASTCLLETYRTRQIDSKNMLHQVLLLCHHFGFEFNQYWVNPIKSQHAPRRC